MDQAAGTARSRPSSSNLDGDEEPVSTKSVAGARSFSELAIDYRSVAALIPYAKNARTHSDAQVAQIAASIREFGWTNPILVDGDNGIIAGHERLISARKLGMANVPVIELAGLSEAQKRALIIAGQQAGS